MKGFHEDTGAAVFGGTQRGAEVLDLAFPLEQALEEIQAAGD